MSDVRSRTAANRSNERFALEIAEHKRRNRHQEEKDDADAIIPSEMISNQRKKGFASLHHSCPEGEVRRIAETAATGSILGTLHGPKPQGSSQGAPGTRWRFPSHQYLCQIQLEPTRLQGMGYQRSRFSTVGTAVIAGLLQVVHIYVDDFGTSNTSDWKPLAVRRPLELGGAQRLEACLTGAITGVWVYLCGKQ
jgi:hypothetical protein